MDHTYIETHLLPLTPIAVAATPVATAITTTGYVLHGFGADPDTTLAALKKTVLGQKKKATIRLVS